MLKALCLHNFKSVEDLDIRLSPLTLLAGLNGSGKSSILQSIALLKQSHDADPAVNHIFLHGSLVQLGRSEDVLFDGARTEDILFRLTTEVGNLEFRCEAKPNADTLDAVFEGEGVELARLFKGFQYIQADRMTPASHYLQASWATREIGSLGSHGEFTVDFLSKNSEMKVSAARRCPANRLRNAIDIELMRSVAPTDYLLDATAAWLQLLSPGVRPVATLVELADSAALRFEYKGYSDIRRDVTSRPHRPSNVGFGLTYILPIIVACLAAPPGVVLLLENPEAHLHPRGQSALGLLISLCAADGVQIIVETHSDHLLNGIRLAAKRRDISADNVQVHFFKRDVTTGRTICESPTLLQNGRFSDWPDGFFDEWGNALDELLED